MPQWGTPDTGESFPSWAVPAQRSKIGRHPHPGTSRTDGRLWWPSDPLNRPLCGRHYGRIFYSSSDPNPGPSYESWEHVTFDIVANGPARAVGTTDTTSRGHRVEICIEWKQTLPLTGLAGTETELTFFKSGVEIGKRVTERPDDTTPYHYDSGWDEISLPGQVREPPDEDPVSAGHWFAFSSVAISECWRWWNDGQVAPCVADFDPSGIAAITVEISDWSWQLNVKGIGGEYTAKQRLFAALLNGRHTVAPVWDDTKGRFSDCRLQKLGPWFRDPDWIIGATPTLHWYSYAIQVHFRADRVQVVLHIRTITGPVKPWFWEPIPSQLFTRFPPIGLGIRNDLLLASDNNLENPWIGFPYPIETRNLEQYGFGKVPMHGTINSPESLDSTAPCNFKLYSCSVEQRGEPPPQQGPDDMFSLQRNHVLAKHDGVARSAHSATDMVFSGAPADTGGWFGSPGDNFVTVPSGVSAIKASGHFYSSSGTPGGYCRILLDGSYPAEGASLSIDDPGGTQRFGGHAEVPYLPVVPGQKVSLSCQRYNGTFDTNTFLNWLYVESLNRIGTLSEVLVPHADPIPGAGDQLYFFRVGDALDGFRLLAPRLSYGSTKSPANAGEFDLSWIRQATRLPVDLLTTPISIDPDHWTSDTAVTQPVVDGTEETMHTGDILVLTVTTVPTGATGLIFNCELSD